MTTVTLEDLRGNPARLRKEAVVRTLFQTAALLTVLVSALIVLSLVREAWTFIANVDWGDQVFGAFGWFPRRDEYGISTLLVGSLVVTIIAMALAAPIGLGAAIYLSEYASPRVRQWLKPSLEVLAGIPSVVLGFFALTVISPHVAQRFFGADSVFNLLAAGLGVGVLTIPLVASVSEDAMRAVPMSLREASYGMGARKVTTTIRVVVPAAVSGLVASLILAVSRAIGETMVVFIAGGAGGNAVFRVDPREPGTTMTAAMASQAAGTDQVVGAALTFQSLFAVGLLLFVITLGFNLVADRFVRRVREAY
jgi:phosphate transport system permease protein